MFTVFALINHLFSLYLLDSKTGETSLTERIYFSVDSNSGQTIDFSFLENKKYENIDILINSDDNSIVLEALKLNIKLESGRNIAQEEYYSGEKLAVIGKNLSNTICNDYITFDNEKYKVVGVIDNGDKKVDYSAYYTKGNNKNVNINNVFIIQGSKKNINTCYNNISKELEDNNMHIKKIDMNTLSIADFINYRYPILILSFLLISLMIFIVIILNILWLYTKKRFLVACFIIGKKNAQLKVFISYIVNNVIYLSCSILINKIIFDTKVNVILLSLIIIIISAIIYIISFMNFSKKHFNELLEISYE